MRGYVQGGEGMGSEWPEEAEGEEEFDLRDGLNMPEKPIEERASEAEKIYANLLMVTDFERDFIEEMLEFEPDEESRMRIGELREKRRHMKQLVDQGFPPQKTIML